jgi:hypothetical protein
VTRFETAWGWDAEGETARETVNLEAWGCESGRGRRLAREVSGEPRGVGVADFQEADIRLTGRERVETANCGHLVNIKNGR